MKILHYLQPVRLPKDPGLEPVSGITRVVFEIAKRQVKLGHQVTIQSTSDASFQAVWEGVRVISSLPAFWAKINIQQKVYDFSSHLPVVLHALTNRYDLVHFHNYGYLRFVRGKRKVFHAHADPYSSPFNNKSVALKPADFDLILRLSDAQIMVSRFVAGQYSRGFQGKGNIHVVHNGVDLDFYQPACRSDFRQNARQSLGLEKNTIAILYAGAIIAEKGVDVLVQAFSESVRDCPHLKLIVAGASSLWGARHLDGSSSQLYEAEIKDRLSPFVRSGQAQLCGKVNQNELLALFTACDFVVIPSIVQEGFPMVALEALASGRPVIASRSGGLPEIVDANSGLLIKPGNEAELKAAILKLSGDPQLRASLGEGGRRTAERFSWDKAVAKIESIYQGLFEGKQL